MHYYKFNIADYRKRTAHLSLVEHAIYRALIDTYYLEESPLCKDIAKLMRSHCIRTDKEKEAFSAVIEEFFFLGENGYHHEKCDEELSKIYAKSDKARASAKKRWDKSNANVMRNECERNANGMLPITQDPLPNTKDNISVEKPKPKTKRDFPHWKLFFDAYPENKKGGTDTSAWKAAKRLNLDDNDFQLMHADVVQRTKVNPEWYSTYALGITRYIGEQFWKTPIDKKQQAKGIFDERQTDEEFFEGIDPKIIGKLLDGPDIDQASLEAGSPERDRVGMVSNLPKAPPNGDGRVWDQDTGNDQQGSQ